MISNIFWLVVAMSGVVYTSWSHDIRLLVLALMGFGAFLLGCYYDVRGKEIKQTATTLATTIKSLDSKSGTKSRDLVKILHSVMQAALPKDVDVRVINTTHNSDEGIGVCVYTRDPKPLPIFLISVNNSCIGTGAPIVAKSYLRDGSQEFQTEFPPDICDVMRVLLHKANR